MTTLKKPITRLSIAELDSHHGADRGRRLVITLRPASGGDDLIEIRPYGTRRAHRVKIVDLYSYVLRATLRRWRNSGSAKRQNVWPRKRAGAGA